MAEYRDLFGGPNATVKVGRNKRTTPVLTPIEIEKLMNKACRLAVRRWREFCDGTTNGFLGPDLTDGTAAMAFVRAKYQADEYPRWLSVCFIPNQIKTAGDKGSYYELLHKIESSDTDNLLNSTRWKMQKNYTFHSFITQQMPIHSHRIPADFPAGIAAEIIDLYCPENARVLDPCHGWGGRLVGFLLANKPTYYLGCDPSEPAHEGVQKAWDCLSQFAEPTKSATLLLSPYEDAKITDQFDFAFTSPPYFNVEKYHGENQSFRRYNTFDRWCTGFYLPLFQKTHKLLKPGAHFAINVGSQSYPLVERGIEFANGTRFKFVGKRTFLLKRHTITKTSEEASEQLLVFRK